MHNTLYVFIHSRLHRWPVISEETTGLAGYACGCTRQRTAIGLETLSLGGFLSLSIRRIPPKPVFLLEALVRPLAGPLSFAETCTTDACASRHLLAVCGAKFEWL